MVLLEPRAAGDPDAGGLLEFIGHAFAHKRKTIRNNLGGIYGKEIVDSWPEAGMRAEQLSLDQFRMLYARVTGS